MEERRGEAVSLAWLGDSATALDLVRSEPAGDPGRELVEAVIAWKRGDRAGARDRLRAVAAHADPYTRSSAWAVLLFMAEEGGRDREVIEAAEALRGLPGAVWRTWAYPRALLASARAYERLGDRSQARAAVDHLLDLWRSADPELPQLAKARALRRKLGEGS
jgi:hypothetical protein